MKTLAIELRMLMRGGRTIAAALVFAFIVLLSGLSSCSLQRHAEGEKSAIAVAERQRWLNQGAKDAHQAAHYSIYAFRRGIPMQVLDPGIQPFVGQAMWLEPHWQNDMIYRPLQEAEPFQRMGIADPARFLVEFAPLLVFLIAFGATAADRETGIMRLALGAARRPATYVWGKWAAVAIFSVATLLIPATVVGLSATAGALDLDNVLRLLAWLVVFAIYLATLSAIGVVVCLNARTARLGFALLLGLWALLAFVAPRVASTSASRITALPSYESVKIEMERQGAGVYWTAEEGERQTQIIMKRYGVSRREDLPVDLRGALIDYNERESHVIFDRVLGAFYGLVTKQDRTFSAQSWMSPAIAAQALSTAFAGSNFAHQQHFIGSAETYRRKLVNEMNGKLMTSSHKSTGAYQINGKTAEASDFNKIPDFRYDPPPIGLAFSSAGVAPLFLVGWFLAGMGLLVWTTRRVHP